MFSEDKWRVIHLKQLDIAEMDDDMMHLTNPWYESTISSIFPAPIEIDTSLVLTRGSA